MKATVFSKEVVMASVMNFSRQIPPALRVAPGGKGHLGAAPRFN